MANTFELISSVTVGAGGASSIDFTSIPSTYTDLICHLSLRGENSSYTFQNAFIKINGVTTSQSRRNILGSGSGTPSSTADTPIYSESVPYGLATNNTFTNGTLYIPNYASSTTYKSMSLDIVGENNATAGRNEFLAGLYASNTAITSLSFTMNVGNIAQYSTAYLYGVKSS